MTEKGRRRFSSWFRSDPEELVKGDSGGGEEAAILSPDQSRQHGDEGERKEGGENGD